MNTRKLGKFPNLVRTDCRQTDQSAMEQVLAGATFGLQSSTGEDENGRRLVDSVIRMAWNAYNVEEEKFEVTLAALSYERLFKDRFCSEAFTTDAGQTVASPRACAQLCYQTSGCEFFVFGTGESTLGQCKFQMPPNSVCSDDAFQESEHDYYHFHGVDRSKPLSKQIVEQRSAMIVIPAETRLEKNQRCPENDLSAVIIISYAGAAVDADEGLDLTEKVYSVSEPFTILGNSPPSVGVDPDTAETLIQVKPSKVYSTSPLFSCFVDPQLDAVDTDSASSLIRVANLRLEIGTDGSYYTAYEREGTSPGNEMPVYGVGRDVKKPVWELQSSKHEIRCQIQLSDGCETGDVASSKSITVLPLETSTEEIDGEPGPASGSALGGHHVYVTGAGFLPRRSYAVSFTNLNGKSHTAVSAKASNTVIKIIMPQWMHAEGLTTVSVSGPILTYVGCFEKNSLTGKIIVATSATGVMDEVSVNRHGKTVGIEKLHSHVSFKRKGVGSY